MSPSSKGRIRRGRSGVIRALVVAAGLAAAAPAGMAAAEEAVTPPTLDELTVLLADLDKQIETLDQAIEEGDARLLALTETLEATDDPAQRSRLDAVIVRLNAALDQMQQRRVEIDRLNRDLAAQVETLRTRQATGTTAEN